MTIAGPGWTARRAVSGLADSPRSQAERHETISREPRPRIKRASPETERGERENCGRSPALHTHTHARTHARKLAHTHTRRNARSTHAQTHARAHAHTRCHTHTHTTPTPTRRGAGAVAGHARPPPPPTPGPTDHHHPRIHHHRDVTPPALPTSRGGENDPGARRRPHQNPTPRAYHPAQIDRPFAALAGVRDDSELG